MAQYPLFMLLALHALAEFCDHINSKLDHNEFSIIMAVARPLFSGAQHSSVARGGAGGLQPPHWPVNQNAE